MANGAANASGGSDPQRASHESDPNRGTPDVNAPGQPVPVVEGELLERVVRETISAVQDDATIARIRAFARRHEAREITDPEVAEELLQVIVAARFGKLPLPPELPGWIAQTLLDDPEATVRLQDLWAQARQAQP